ncbi:hypothetical protein IFM89_018924 [Coptis chinensis]|uniref:Uncharacterized protein n=1 Tax=Coptis chinensis TaxID=261450 RepID=A0A835HIH4_9MAGN|nr:hypothetical protein IFM89_018924 [Coptis chinensis]
MRTKSTHHLLPTSIRSTMGREGSSPYIVVCCSSDWVVEKPKLIKTTSKVYILEGKLEEALSILKIKESRVVELEGILNETELPKGEPRSASLVPTGRGLAEIESELEDLFQKKIEAEVECLAMRKISRS